MTKKKILALDDDDMILDYLNRKLSESDEIVTSTNASLAVQLALHEKPDLILCDIDMPGVDGGEVCAALASNTTTALIPFLYLTSIVTANEAWEMGGMVGGRPGIGKDAPLPELIWAIEKMLNR